MNNFVEISISKDVLYDSFKVSIIVGLLLNIINQSEYILNVDLGHIDYLKLGVTFLIPFVVSNYAATKAKLAFKIGGKAPLKTKIKCQNCNQYSTEVNKNETIPICKNCLEKADWRPINEN